MGIGTKGARGGAQPPPNNSTGGSPPPNNGTLYSGEKNWTSNSDGDSHRFAQNDLPHL